MCMDAYIRFVIIMFLFFLLGALGTPRANYIMVRHFPKKWGNATMPQCQGLVLVKGTTVTVGRGRLMVAS